MTFCGPPAAVSGFLWQLSYPDISKTDWRAGITVRLKFDRRGTETPVKGLADE